MNQLSLRNNRLKFKSAGKSPVIIEEFIEYTPIQERKTRRMSTCNQLDLQITLGSQPVMPKISRITGPYCGFNWYTLYNVYKWNIIILAIVMWVTSIFLSILERKRNCESIKLTFK